MPTDKLRAQMYLRTDQLLTFSDVSPYLLGTHILSMEDFCTSLLQICYHLSGAITILFIIENVLGPY